MKKILCILLAVLMLSMALVACGETNKEPLKIGLGVYTTATATDATADTKGKAQATVTAAAVLVDANGKIVKCLIDCVNPNATYNIQGAVSGDSYFKSKRWLGDDYGMVRAGAAKEWYEQVNAFQKLCVGKTADEVLALVADGDKGTDEVIRAGCTITVNEMALAVEKAVKNAKDSTATASDTLRLGIDSVVSELKCANGDVNAKIGFETSIVAFAVRNDNSNEKRAITAVYMDCVAVNFAATVEGASIFDASAPILTKREQGDAYGMVAYGGAKLEWYEQVDALESLLIGFDPLSKDKLEGENRQGNEDVIAAGCTIAVIDLTNALGLAYVID